MCKARYTDNQLLGTTNIANFIIQILVSVELVTHPDYCYYHY